MPLVKGMKAKSKKGISENIRREKHAHPEMKQSQAVAIAFSEARRGKKKGKEEMNPGLSCEIPTETVSTCIHGVPIKFECGSCNDQHRINLLESQVKALTEFHKEFKDVLKTDLKIHEKMWNDVFDRLDKLEMMYKIERKVERIAELEKNNKDWINGDNEIMKVVREHEKTLNHVINLSDMINRSIKIFQDNDGLKPHKCPICNGSGNHPDQSLRLGVKVFMDNNKYVCISCDSCDGKGILWG